MKGPAYDWVWQKKDAVAQVCPFRPVPPFLTPFCPPFEVLGHLPEFFGSRSYYFASVFSYVHAF